MKTNIAKNCTASLLVALCTLLLASCSSWGTTEAANPPEFLVIGYWHSMVGSNLSFHLDGHIEYRRGGPNSRSSKLSQEEQDRLAEHLSSAGFQASLAWLRANGYRPGCCDQQEVGMFYQDENLGFPVCTEEALPRSVENFIVLINELASQHFGRQYAKLPISTCKGLESI